jgi:peroxiredoxin
LADVAAAKPAIDATGTQVAFVHMSPPDEADAWFERYGLNDVVRISDPEKSLYRQFGLEEGSLYQLAHPRVWLRSDSCRDPARQLRGPSQLC